MTKEIFINRFNDAISKVMSKARESLIEDLPDQYMFILEFRDRKKIGPISKEDSLNHLIKNGKVPRWINIYFSKIDHDKSIIGCQFSDEYFEHDEELLYEDEGMPPFRVGYPNLPKVYQKGKKYSIKDLTRE